MGCFHDASLDLYVSYSNVFVRDPKHVCMCDNDFKKGCILKKMSLTSLYDIAYAITTFLNQGKTI